MIEIRIKELRLEKGLTQVQVSKSIGYSNSVLSDWERGEKQPTAHAIIKLCEFFSVSADYLLGLSEEDTAFLHKKSVVSDEKIVSEIFKILKSLDAFELREVNAFIQGIKSAKHKPL